MGGDFAERALAFVDGLEAEEHGASPHHAMGRPFRDAEGHRAARRSVGARKSRYDCKMARPGCGLLAAWLFAGCDPSASSALPAPSDTGGAATTTATTTAATGDTTSTSDPPTTTSSNPSSDGMEPALDLPPICDEYLDEPELELELRITNLTDTDVYLFDVDDCGSIESIWQIHTEDDGRWPTPCGLPQCETAIGRSCLESWCFDWCLDVGGIRLLPGATYTEAFGGRVRMETTLAAECTIECDDEPCLWARRLLTDEPAEVHVLVSPDPMCVDGSPCSCAAGAIGWCETPDLDHDAAREELVLPAVVTGEAVEVVIEG